MEHDERRRFYRIDDRLELSLRRADSDAETLTGLERFRRYDQTLVGIDREIQELVDASSVPELADFMRLIDRKFDYLFDALGLGDELAKRSVFAETEVNISGSGAAFRVPEKYQMGEALLLMIRFPDCEKTLSAVVIRCDPVDGDMPFMLYLDFPDITLEDQEFIIHYVAVRQGEMLAKRRLEREAKASD